MTNASLIDSGPLIALFDKSDSYHTRAVDFIKNYGGRLITTTAVLTEVCYMLDFNINAQIDFLSWIKEGAVELVPVTNEDIDGIITLIKKYSDLPADFADSTLVAIGNRLNIERIVSVDKDFYIYRFRKNRPFRNIFF